MPGIDFTSFFQQARPLVEAGIQWHKPVSPGPESSAFNEAVEYTLSSQGKLFRPLLTLFLVDALGGDVTKAVPVAVAIEYVHASSLILDDLPSMDNGALRRGRPALHVRFGEALAVLTAIALLNRAYELVLETDSPRHVKIHRQLTRAVGAAGMIRGQAADLVAHMAPGRADGDLGRGSQEVLLLKTTALFRLCLISGALLSDAPDAVLGELERYAVALGTAFQCRDDILDISEDANRISEPDVALRSSLASCDRDRIFHEKHQQLLRALDAAATAAARLTPERLSGSLQQVTAMFFPLLSESNETAAPPEPSVAVALGA